MMLGCPIRKVSFNLPKQMLITQRLKPSIENTTMQKHMPNLKMQLIESHQLLPNMLMLKM
jgi:hypothetical protein